ncbi:MAG: beta-propeller fold lactonase family protein [Acidobacteria bacterium]|nr:beta-propeller fold lactonase family protein [Acidobacteriota bacterium]
MTFSKDGKTAFVTNENAAMVGVIDVAKRKVVSTITIPKTAGTPTLPRPMGGALSPDGQQVFISLGRASSVAVIDVATRKFVRTIEGVGARPWGLTFNADGSKLFTANGPSGDVSIVDVASGKVRTAALRGAAIAVPENSPAKLITSKRFVRFRTSI